MGANRAVISIRPTWISFGGTAAIVTSMSLVLGLEAAASSQRGIIGALLIVALADNLSDSLSVHIYQEAERLESRAAFVSTLANFVARLLVSLSFVLLVIIARPDLMPLTVIAWGFLLLTLLTYRIACARGVPPGREIGKHLAVAAVVLGISRWLGSLIAGTFA
jgi:hypothetical protein